MDHEDIVAARRISRLIENAQPNFSLINVMFGVLVIAMIITAVGSVFSG